MQAADRSASSSVRRPALKGLQAVAGQWFPRSWYSPAQQRQLLLANWSPGASAHLFPEGLLLCHARSEIRDCGLLPGWPLRREGRTLCSAELTAGEIAGLPVADVWLVHGADVTCLQTSPATQLDPSSWISCDDYSLLDTYDCSASLAAPDTPLLRKPAAMSEVLGAGVPVPDEKRDSFLKLLQARTDAANHHPSAPGRKKNTATPGASRSGPGGLLPSWLVIPGVMLACLAILYFPWVLLFAFMFFLLSQWWGGGTAAPSGWADATPTRSIPPRQSKVLPQRWRSWLARAAMISKLSALVGRRQAAYVRRMLQMFEEGDLQEALRHAIPLGGNGSLGQAFGNPRARSNLALGAQRGASSSVNLGDELNAHLRALYRKSFERLDREKQTEAAVFVLAELLNNYKEALDYLEKQGKYAQAAELALLWDQAPDTIVRLLCLASDWRRAIAVARRDNAFANAVLLLEKWPEAARQLREEWAQALAAQGEWLEAVEALWPLENARDQAIAWLAQAEASGGVLAARALVKRACLLPDTLEHYAAYLEALREDPERSTERMALVQAVLNLDKVGKAQALARMLAGPVLADQAAGKGQLTKKSLQKLLRISGDALLQADLPNQSLPVAESQPLTKRKSRLDLQAPDVGLLGIRDAVALDDGRHMLALGEAGAVIIDAQGRRLQRFSTPAEHLVVAHSRQIVLALARRDGMWRISRIDISQRLVTDLGLLRLSHWASELNGIAWTVISDNCLRVLDAGQAQLPVLWQVNDLPGQVLAFHGDAHNEQVLLVMANGEQELWHYQLPQRRLTARNDVSAAADEIRLLSPVGMLRLRQETGTTGQPVLKLVQYGGYSLPVEIGLTEQTPLQAACAGNGWVVLLQQGLQQQAICWWTNYAGKPSACLEWPQPQNLQIRWQGEACLVFDSRGRLLHLDCSDSTVTAISAQ